MNAMTEVTVGDHTYGIRQLDAFQQLHIVRRLAPVLTSLGMTVDKEGKPQVGNPFEQLQPAAEMLANMPDEHVEYVLKTCLLAVYRKGERGFSPVMANGVNMFSADLDIGVQLQLAWEVGKANLGGFMRMVQQLGVMKGLAPPPTS